MLVTFRSEAYSNITMFGDVATKLLKMMGHSGTVPGAIMAEDVPAALARLKTGIEAVKAKPKTDSTEKERDKNWKDDKEQDVSLAHRALPLLELLEASAKEKCNVMWDK